MSASLQWGMGSTAVSFMGHTFPVSLSAMTPSMHMPLYIDSLKGGLRPSLTPLRFGPGGMPTEP